MDIDADRPHRDSSSSSPRHEVTCDVRFADRTPRDISLHAHRLLYISCSMQHLKASNRVRQLYSWEAPPCCNAYSFCWLCNRIIRQKCARGFTQATHQCLLKNVGRTLHTREGQCKIQRRWLHRPPPCRLPGALPFHDKTPLAHGKQTTMET